MAFVKEFMSEQDIARYKRVYKLRSQWVIDREMGVFLRSSSSTDRPDMGGPTDEWHFSYQGKQLLLELGYFHSPLNNNEPYFTQWVAKICRWEDEREITLEEALDFIGLSKRAFTKMLQDSYKYYRDYGYLDPSKKERDNGYIFIFKGEVL